MGGGLGDGVGVGKLMQLNAHVMFSLQPDVPTTAITMVAVCIRDTVRVHPGTTD